MLKSGILTPEFPIFFLAMPSWHLYQDQITDSIKVSRKIKNKRNNCYRSWWNLSDPVTGERLEQMHTIQRRGTEGEFFSQSVSTAHPDEKKPRITARVASQSISTESPLSQGYNFCRVSVSEPRPIPVPVQGLCSSSP